MKRLFSQSLILFFATLLPSFLNAQCPDLLLWTNGESLWAYRAVDCSGEYCNKATDQVLIYGSELKSTGCVKEEEACNCRAAETKPLDSVEAVGADLPIQNRGCQTIDSFVVKIGEDHIQCVEFRFVPDQGQFDDFGQAVARNMRLSIKLAGKPEKGASNLLVDDSAKISGDAVVRKVGEMEVIYPMLKSGVQTLEKLVVREAPVTQQEEKKEAGSENIDSESKENRPGPDEDGSSRT